MNEAYIAGLKDYGPFPVRTCVGVAALPAGTDVEMTIVSSPCCFAIMPLDCSLILDRRETTWRRFPLVPQREPSAYIDYMHVMAYPCYLYRYFFLTAMTIRSPSSRFMLAKLAPLFITLPW